MQAEANRIVRSRSSEQVSEFIRAVADACEFLQSMAWFIHGMGGQPKAFYQNLPPSDDYEVLGTSSAMGKWLTRLAPFLAGWSGVVRVRNCSRLPSLFEMIGEQSMAAIYAFDVGRLDDFARVARELPSELERMVESDPRHFVYIVDEDSATTDGEVVEIVKWGPKCPSSLSGLIQGNDD